MKNEKRKMKKGKQCTVMAIIVIIGIVCAACDNGSKPQAKTYTVTFDSNGGSKINSISGLNSGDTITEPTIPTKTGYDSKFVGWYDQTLINEFDFDTEITADITLYAKWRPYELGETGLGGGKIFYRSETGFTMMDTNETCHYLEAAPADMPAKLMWASTAHQSTDITNGILDVEIGYGRKNTTRILSIDSTAPAALACDEYISNGISDWFLPSWHELNELYMNRNSIGNLQTDLQPDLETGGLSFPGYWSSTQQANIYGICIGFNDGGAGGNPKNGTYFVRAIRAF